EEWRSVVREFFWDWQPTPQEAHAYIGTSDENRIGQMLQSLLRVHPILPVRMAKSFLLAARTPEVRTPFRTALFRIYKNLTGVGDMGQSKLETIAASMQVDRVFLERSLLTPARSLLKNGVLTARETDNIRVALGVEVFRDYLAY